MKGSGGPCQQLVGNFLSCQMLGDGDLDELLPWFAFITGSPHPFLDSRLNIHSTPVSLLPASRRKTFAMLQAVAPIVELDIESGRLT